MDWVDFIRLILKLHHTNAPTPRPHPHQVEFIRWKMRDSTWCRVSYLSKPIWTSTCFLLVRHRNICACTSTYDPYENGKIKHPPPIMTNLPSFLTFFFSFFLFEACVWRKSYHTQYSNEATTLSQINEPLRIDSCTTKDRTAHYILVIQVKLHTTLKVLGTMTCTCELV